MEIPLAIGDTALRIAGAVPAAGCPGVTDRVNAFGVSAIHFDPTRTDPQSVVDWLSAQPTSAELPASTRLVEITVLYDGADLSRLGAGLDTHEAIHRHSTAEYHVGAVGFQPGFGYLEGLPPELHTPRRGSPRTRVPAGSVGIGGPYTGVYPSDSPGGWNLIGRTPLRMWDAWRKEPSLLGAGDRVCFRAIDAAEFDRLAAQQQPAPARPPTACERPLLRLASKGLETTIQDLGRPGRQHLGVSPGGAMDPLSVRLANLLVGNPPEAPTLESTLVGPVLEALEPVTLAVTGAVPTAAVRRLGRGDRLDLRRLVGGARAYVALRGGLAGQPGAILEDGCRIGAAATSQGPRPSGAVSVHTAAWLRDADGSATLHVTRGPEADRFDAGQWARVMGEPFEVSPQSNRMGVRLAGPALTPRDCDALTSAPVTTGCVQIPPDGRPIALGADRQTLGGYPVIAVIASADWPKLGQLRPGDTVRFAEVDLATAARMRRRLERDLAMVAAAISLGTE